MFSPLFPLFPLHFSLLPSFQLQLLHSCIRVWEGAPDCRRVRVAQDVPAKPAPADRCRSLCQREHRWFLPEPQQQLQQHQERDTVSLATWTNTHSNTSQLTRDVIRFVCVPVYSSIPVGKLMVLWVFTSTRVVATGNTSRKVPIQVH